MLLAALIVPEIHSMPESRSIDPRSSESQGSSSRLRILCLHGYHGSAATLRSQMASLVDGLDSLAEFVCIDAPSLAVGDFGWWHAKAERNAATSEDAGVGPKPKYYSGWQRTRDDIVAAFARLGPFDGLFGFSQGAALTALLVGLRAPDGIATAAKPLSFDFAVMVGGFPAADPDLSKIYDETRSYRLPSLHIIGRSDRIVPADVSRDLARRFFHPQFLEHDDGHVVAATPEVRAGFRSFLEQMLMRKREAADGAPVPRPQLQVPLWPGRKNTLMTLVFPTAATGRPLPAMLVFPGGAYASCHGSGGDLAEWAADHDMVGIRVEYGTRSTREAYPDNYCDAARAVRLVRRHASQWGIDEKRIGVAGFSAGGHLASLVSTQPDLHRHPDDDLSGQVSARPDLLVLAYPVISFVDGYYPGAFLGTVDNFFGHDVSEATRRAFSSELHVDETHPPVFIWTTRDDPIVPHTHSQLFADACARAKVPVTFRVYPHGPHGLGLALSSPGDLGNWTNSLLAWLSTQWSVSPAPLG